MPQMYLIIIAIAMLLAAIALSVLYSKTMTLQSGLAAQSERVSEHHRYFIDLCQALDDRLTRIKTHHGGLIDQHHNLLKVQSLLLDKDSLFVRALARDVGDLRADAEFTRIEQATKPGPIVVNHDIDGTSPYTIQYWLEELAQLEAEATLHGIELTIGAKLSR
ncbi:hypothetical protein [Aeromonas phage Asp37]|nr:hypothetical protein [Aeromonas phage Asp37]